VSLHKLSSYFGFTGTPFRRNLAPAMLHRHGGHAEAVARIRWCVAETALG
jgi:type II secretory pathway predicted ATPase ExeA